MLRFQYTVNPPGGQGPRSGPRQYTDLLADVRTRAGPFRPLAACGPHANARITGSRSLKVRSPPGYPRPRTDRFPFGWLPVQAGRQRTAARVRRTHGQAGKRRGDGSQPRRRPPTDAKPALPSERDHRSMLHGQLATSGDLTPSRRRLPATPATVIRADVTQLFGTVLAQRKSAARAPLPCTNAGERVSLGWGGCQPTSGGSRRRESTAKPGEAVSGAFPMRVPQHSLRRQAAASQGRGDA